MDETPKDEEGWRRWAAAEKERALRQSRAQEEWWRQRFDVQEEELLRQNNLMYGALIGIGVVMVQPFLTASSLDLSAKICVVAFSVAIPLLAALVMVNWQETYRRRQTKSFLVQAARALAQTSTFVGVVAGFWHILPMAGIGVLVFGLLGLAVHSSGIVRVELDGAKAPPDADDGPAQDAEPGQDDGPKSGT